MATIEDRRVRTAPTHGLIAHRYELGQPLARGGMATLWRGWDRRLCRPVAVKTLRDDDLHDEGAYSRLRREALVSAAISHPHIVEVHDLIEEHGRPYLIMELVEGEDLKRHIYQRGPLDPFSAVDIARQILRALLAAHLRGVIHRDVKPHNVLLTSGMRAKLADFGLALSPLDTSPEQKDIVFGTPEYMAPEQAMGEPISPATDLYGLGVTLYESLTGDAPFTGPSAEETMKRHITMPVTPLRALRADLPRPIEDVVMRALEKEPERRFASAEQMDQALCEAAYEARRRHERFALSAWPPESEAMYPTDLSMSAHASHKAWPRGRRSRPESKPAQLPEMFWIRLMWVVFALNIMLAITLLCAFVLHLTM